MAMPVEVEAMEVEIGLEEEKLRAREQWGAYPCGATFAMRRSIGWNVIITATK